MSFPRRRESRFFGAFWTPGACPGPRSGVRLGDPARGFFNTLLNADHRTQVKPAWLFL